MKNRPAQDTPVARRSGGRLALKILAWVVGVLLILIVAVALFVAFFDWNRARPWINHKVSDELGRPFAINGDLSVRWRHPPDAPGWRGWIPWPHVRAKNITLANTDWARTPSMASVDQVDFDIAIPPLLVKHVVIPTIALSNPVVDIERKLDGRNNYTFATKSSGQPSAWSVDLHDITFGTGKVALLEESRKADLNATIDTLGNPIPFGDVLKQQSTVARDESAGVVGKQGAAQFRKAAVANEASQAQAASATSAASAAEAVSGAMAQTASGASGTASASAVASASSAAVARVAPQSIDPYKIAWTIAGKYNGTPVSGSGKLGEVLSLRDATRPFPLQADVKIGDTRIALVGTLTDPVHLASLDLRLWLQGTSLSHLYALTGVTLPSSPPFATEGRLVGEFKKSGDIFRYQNFTGRVGGSDLNGTLVYEGVKPRPRLSGALVSHLLQFSDLAPLIGADSNKSKEVRGATTKQPADKALPVEEFRTDRWKAIDANVEFTGKRILRDKDLPITDLYTHVIMTDGVLKLVPLRFGVAGGNITSDINLDGSTTPLKAKMSLGARHVKLKQLFPTSKTMQQALGEINGEGALSATGNSPAALAASSNGEIKLLVNQGAVSAFLMEAAGLNIANAVVEKLFGNRDVKINCAASDFVVTNGKLDSKVFIVDTDDAVINVDGSIDLKSETMDLGVHPHTKGFRVFSLRSPLYVKGTFKKPSIGVNPVPLALKGAGAIVLGLINPFAALIPLLSPSHNTDTPCSQLLAAMNKSTKAPPPGQKMSPHAADATVRAVTGKTAK
ncbi:AsmA family protein [Robbsia sp. Bb-Pol-6]|uniref:AsmA family protein n=2 Tax=Robbsia betulipollinis TaxID=2981849 RepID=A0ABT3ZP91_9BURK|nr:AsmA family protein [Robbsia betulipollinis]MCY0388050.1 AsmA family protein [Robbsia betulipollinis]